MPKGSGALRPTFITISPDFERVVHDVFQELIGQLSANDTKPQYAVCFTRVQNGAYTKRHSKVLIDNLSSVLTSPEAEVVREDCKQPRTSFSKDLQSSKKLTDKVNIVGLHAIAKSYKKKYLVRSDEGISKVPLIAFFNYVTKSAIGNMAITRQVIELEINEEYSAVVYSNLSSNLTKHELVFPAVDPIADLEHFLIEQKQAVPDLDLIVWEYNSTFAVLESVASSIEDIILDLPEATPLIWDCYDQQSQTVSANLRQSVSKKRRPGENTFGDLEHVIKERRWRSGKFMPLVVGGRCRGVIGFMSQYYGGLDTKYENIYKPY